MSFFWREKQLSLSVLLVCEGENNFLNQLSVNLFIFVLNTTAVYEHSIFYPIYIFFARIPLQSGNLKNLSLLSAAALPPLFPAHHLSLVIIQLR